MKKYIPRKRTRWLAGGSLAILAYTIYTDPDGHGWAKIAVFLGQLATPILAIWFSYIGLKALFDYFDGEELVKKATETALGSAIIFLSRAIVLFGLLGLFGSQLSHAADVRTDIPAQAVQYLPVVKAEQLRLWPDHPKATSLLVSSNTRVALA